MKLLHLYLQGPLMSFGAPAVDDVRPAGPFPTRSMVTGLLANALGWRHGDFERLQALQAALRVAARADVPGVPLRDYQTVDLSQPFLHAGWTSWGVPEGRGGGSSKGTHIRQRHYLADAVFLLVLGLRAEAPVTLEALAEALRRPARPLFLGRKSCLPAMPLWPGELQSEGLAAALAELPRHARARQQGPLQAWAPVDDPSVPAEPLWRRELPTLRDWRNQVHVGREAVAHFLVRPPTAEVSRD